MSMMAYCSKVKQLGDQLRDLGSPVDNQNLLINFSESCFLNPRLHNVIPSITINKPLPSFLKGSNGTVACLADSVLLGLNAQSAPAGISTTSSSTSGLGKKQ
ncbi:uncharacterized protein C2845_PM15G02900 [Panicum miliaceum]|uniref:Uncharacterized protein n=1 Tax=Panicum miliaceum TaxID=4540 RepID=A0A3L6QCV8_PANMI|nr:uncharacterized protein C2845_PM15G02900 [Panicum miliaceum]